MHGIHVFFIIRLTLKFVQNIDNLICVWDLIHPQNEQASSTTLAPSTLGWFYILFTTASTKDSTNQKQWYEGENAHQTIAEVLPVKISCLKGRIREFIAILGFGCVSFGTNISLINMLLFIVAIFFILKMLKYSMHYK